jgi:hypothetical protein
LPGKFKSAVSIPYLNIDEPIKADIYRVKMKPRAAIAVRGLSYSLPDSKVAVPLKY